MYPATDRRVRMRDRSMKRDIPTVLFDTYALHEKGAALSDEGSIRKDGGCGSEGVLQKARFLCFAEF